MTHLANPIKHHGHLPPKNYTLILNDAVRDHRITANAFRVLSLLLSHDGGYQESVREVAKRYGWATRTAKAAFDLLRAERLLIVQKHLTAKGTRAYEVYHVHRSRRFTEAEVAEHGVAVTLVPNEHQGRCRNDIRGDAQMTSGAMPSKHHTEDQLEEQRKDKREEQCARLFDNSASPHPQAKKNSRSHKSHDVEESPFTDGLDEEELEHLADVIFLPDLEDFEQARVNAHNRLIEWARNNPEKAYVNL